jgi:hypothetical protein
MSSDESSFHLNSGLLAALAYQRSVAAAVFLLFGIVLAVGQPTAQFIYFQF